MFVGTLEKIKSRSDMAPVRNQNLEDPVQVFGQRLETKLNHRIERPMGLVGQTGLAVDLYKVREECRG